MRSYKTLSITLSIILISYITYRELVPNIKIEKQIQNSLNVAHEGILQAINTQERRNLDILFNFLRMSWGLKENSRGWQNCQKPKQIDYTAKRLIKEVNELKIKLILESENIDKYDVDKIIENNAYSKIKTLNNYQIPNHIFFGYNNQSEQLKNKIDLFKTYLFTFLDDKSQEGLYKDGLNDFSLNLNQWQEKYFKNSTLQTYLLSLDKIILDIKIAEFYTIAKIQEGSSGFIPEFNVLKTLVVPKSKMIKQGDIFEAEIMLAGLDTSARNIITINGITQKSDSNIYIYKTKATKLGTNKTNGFLHVYSPDMYQYTMPFTIEFEVVK